jgi:hypothetical protein
LEALLPTKRSRSFAPRFSSKPDLENEDESIQSEQLPNLLLNRSWREARRRFRGEGVPLGTDGGSPIALPPFVPDAPTSAVPSKLSLLAGNLFWQTI